jgi:hypothetical protein
MLLFLFGTAETVAARHGLRIADDRPIDLDAVARFEVSVKLDHIAAAAISSCTGKSWREIPLRDNSRIDQAFPAPSERVGSGVLATGINT